MRAVSLALILTGALFAGQPGKPAQTRGENESVVIKATAYVEPQAVKELLGSDLDGHYIVVAVEVTPRFGKEVTIDRDDFMLKTDKDGERTTPFAPSQIAGRGALVISQTSGGGAGAASNPTGPIWGGIPGTGSIPTRLPGPGANVGNTGDVGATKATSRSGSKDKPNPMLDVLKQKELPQAKTSQPVSGLLYFPMEKQKAKDLELRYNALDDKIVMRFRQEK